MTSAAPHVATEAVAPKGQAVVAPPPAPPPPPSFAPAATTPAPKALASGDAADEPAREPGLVVYTAKLELAVHRVEESLALVEKIARDQGGFLASKQDRQITVRVPRARFQQALAGVDKVGDVLHRDVSAVDVTEEHVDLEVRIKNAKATQARLKELLAKANVKEAIEIEKELHRVTGELEALEGKLKVLRDRVAYSTITVAFVERVSAAPARAPQLPFPWLSQLGLGRLLSLSEEK